MRGGFSAEKGSGLNESTASFATSTGSRSPTKRDSRSRAFFQGAASREAAQPELQPHQRSLVELAEDLVRGGGER